MKIEQLSMNWYVSQSNSMVKTAGYSAYVKGFNIPDQWRTIDEICQRLNHILYTEMDKNKIPLVGGRPSFDPDGQDDTEPIGIINFYVFRLDPKYFFWVTNFVLNTLTRKNIKVSEIRQDGYPADTFSQGSAAAKELEGKVRVIRFVISQNKNTRGDVPEELHWTGSTVSQVLKVLGLSFNVDDAEYKTIDIKNAFERLLIEQHNQQVSMQNLVGQKIGIIKKEEANNFQGDYSNLALIERNVRKLYTMADWAYERGHDFIYFA